MTRSLAACCASKKRDAMPTFLVLVFLPPMSCVSRAVRTTPPESAESQPDQGRWNLPVRDAAVALMSLHPAPEIFDRLFQPSDDADILAQEETGLTGVPDATQRNVDPAAQM